MRKLLTAAFVLVVAGTANAGTVINFTGSTGDANADGAFNMAKSVWESILQDNVTVNIQRGFTSQSTGILASASSSQSAFTYVSTRSALVIDATSADDATAVANLEAGPATSFFINRTANSPNGPGNATPYFDNDGDANNTTIFMTFANAKALGLRAANDAAVDASLNFNSTGGFTWDYDPTDGITAGTFDFVGIAIHEIGHALGFISGVDVLDINSPPVNGPFNDDQFTFRSVLDLYRYSALGRDWTADTRTKTFSIDGGATSLATFSTGSFFGDGSQASHWKDNLGLGIMDPTFAPGQLGALTMLDLRAFDVIGWNMVVPLPRSAWMGLAMLGGLGIVTRLRRRRQVA